MKVKKFLVSKASQFEGDDLYICHLGVFDTLEQAEKAVADDKSVELEENLFLNSNECTYDDPHYVKLHMLWNDFGSIAFTWRVEETDIEVDTQIWGQVLSELTDALSRHLPEEYDSHVATLKLQEYADEFVEQMNAALTQNHKFEYGREMLYFVAGKAKEFYDYINEEEK